MNPKASRLTFYLSRLFAVLSLAALATGAWTEARGPISQRHSAQGPFASEPVAPHVLTADLRTLPLAEAWQPGDPVREVPRGGSNRSQPWQVGASADPAPASGLQDERGGAFGELTAVRNFEGISATGFVPPDTVGDVGPNHFIQAVNVAFAIFSKNGDMLVGPLDINTLWDGEGGACETQNDGDPVVLYDPLANRWLISQFALPTGFTNPHQCIAISQTGDPISGGWFLYDFRLPEQNDYPKFGVWPDAYYMSTNESTGAASGAYAFDRTRMLAGLPATFIQFSQPGNFMLPSDLDGLTPPPAGSPNYYFTIEDDDFWGGGPDRVEIFEFHVDFADPPDSTFTGPTTLITAPFDYTVCGFFVFPCIPQPAPGEKLDAISEWPMWRLQYRNFGAYETLVNNHAVDVDGTNHAGIRWYELRRAGGSWSIQQQGTYAPDSAHRWIGSMAMDRAGNIAVGYSVSSISLFPSIRYVGRRPGDPPGTLPRGEQTLIAGGGAQASGFNRWGDYSALTVDPVDDCTFWYTNEYYRTTSESSWRTRIGAFRAPGCRRTAGDN